MEFEWNEAKNAANLAKHGISFRQAIRIFEGRVVTRPARIVDGETRSMSIGRIDELLVIAVIHADRSGRLRIISARPARREERRTYHGHSPREA